jgi:hypothetical protein
LGDPIALDWADRQNSPYAPSRLAARTVGLPWEYAGGFKAKNSTSEGNYYYGFYSIIRMALSLLVAALRPPQAFAVNEISG